MILYFRAEESQNLEVRFVLIKKFLVPARKLLFFSGAVMLYL